ncbi:SGS-domain-containing protein [Lactarius psammicola]|nr:SGS-domain-containing protein [Lactarius psammicola]
MATTIRHEFYETDEKLILTLFDRGADPAQVNVKFELRNTVREWRQKFAFRPLKGQIDPEQSSFVVGKVKVELRLVKAAQGRWGGLIGDAPDPLANSARVSAPATKAGSTLPQARKNWDSVTQTILDSEKAKTSSEDPNVSGDSTLNEFFQNLFANADDNTKKAMMKSFQESGGTALSTNWDEVSQGPVPIKPPTGSEARKWEN